MPVNLEKLPEGFIPEAGFHAEFWVFFGFCRFVWGLLSSRRSRSKRRDGFPPVCLALCLISVCLCVSWSGRKFWAGLDFYYGCLVAGQLGKTVGKFYPGGRKIFRSELWLFFGFSCFVLSGVGCRLVEVVQNVETVFPVSVCVVLSLVSVRLCVS